MKGCLVKAATQCKIRTIGRRPRRDHRPNAQGLDEIIETNAGPLVPDRDWEMGGMRRAMRGDFEDRASATVGMASTVEAAGSHTKCCDKMQNCFCCQGAPKPPKRWRMAS